MFADDQGRLTAASVAETFDITEEMAQHGLDAMAADDIVSHDDGYYTIERKLDAARFAAKHISGITAKDLVDAWQAR